MLEAVSGRYSLSCLLGRPSYALIKGYKSNDKSNKGVELTSLTAMHLWQVNSISAFCYLSGGEHKPSSGRKVARDSVTEGARVSLRLDDAFNLRTLPQSRSYAERYCLPAPSRREPYVTLRISAEASICL